MGFQKKKAYLGTVLDFAVNAMPHNASSRLVSLQDKIALTASENLAGSADYYREKGQNSLAGRIFAYADRLQAYEEKDPVFSNPYEAALALYKSLEPETLENILGYRVIPVLKSGVPVVTGINTLKITALLSELGL